MGWLQKVFSRRSKPSPITSVVAPAFPGFTFDSIKQNMTVTACTNILTNAISILPLNLYKKNPDGTRQKVTDSRLYRILRRAPNSYESPTQFMAKLVRHIIQGGNAYLFKGRAGTSLESLTLLNPSAVRRVTSDWPRIAYWYNGTAYTDSDILHIPNLITDDGGTGYAPVDLARAAVILGAQLDEYSLSSFGNGLNTKLLIDIAEMTKDVKSEEEASKIAATVADYIRRHYTGADNAGKPLVIWNGMKLEELKHQSSNRDAELLDSRKWQEAEICKVFGVPLFLVNNSYSVPYGGLEQAMIVFLNFTLSPYLRHIEQRLWTLLDQQEQLDHYFEFDFNVLLRPDEKSRAEFYSKLFQMGAISPAGICARENMEPPAEAGDSRFVPVNMLPLTQENIDAFMASAKSASGPIKDPARGAGDDKL